jgi:hypothetical protein
MSTATLAALTRGEVPERLPSDADACEALLQRAEEQGVSAFARHALKAAGRWHQLPVAVRQGLDRYARSEAATEALRTRHLQRVLEACASADIHGLVFKGAALAHTHYPAPSLRPRNDTDVFVRKADVERAVRVLEGLGYEPVLSVAREALFTQRAFACRLAGGVTDYIDLHWALSNRPLFAAMFSFEEIVARATAVPGLGPHARVPDAVDALLIAVFHRLSHNDSHLLMWLLDIKLLADSLTPAQWEQAVGRATVKGLVAACRDSLRVTGDMLGGCEEGLRRFASLGKVQTEPAAVYIGGVDRQWKRTAQDLAATPGVLPKARLLWGHVMPDADYMRRRYGAGNATSLAGAYVRRGVRGLWRAVTVPLGRDVARAERNG